MDAPVYFNFVWHTFAYCLNTLKTAALVSQLLLVDTRDVKPDFLENQFLVVENRF